ncbi:MAG: oligosaccharide flippase family protein [Candidatus Omnitrophica bacterium]|nr:oligosaccharide flippase family protein [Candidatus Omnitrophota bacterium]
MKKNVTIKIMQNILSLGFAQILTGIIHLGLFVFLARVLEVKTFGKYEFSLSFYTFFGYIAAFGMNKIGMREVARVHEDSSEKVSLFTGNLLSLRLILSLLSYALLFAAVMMINKPQEMKNLILLNGSALFFGFLSLEWLFIGIEKMQYVLVSRVVKAATFLLLALLMVKGPESLMFVAAARVISVVAGIFVLLFFYGKIYGKIKLHKNYDTWKYILRASYPIFATTIMTGIYLKLDSIMLGFMKTNTDVGLYSAVYRIILFFVGIRALALTSIFPALSVSFKRSKEELDTLVTVSTKTALFFMVPISIILFFGAPQIIDIVLGSSYLKGVDAFRILCFSLFILGLNFVFNQLQIACDRENIYLRIIIFGVLTNIVLNALLIPRFGIEGAAAATVAADIAALIVSWFCSKDVVSVNIPKMIFPPVLGAIIMTIVIIMTYNVNMLVALLSGCTAYVTILFFLNYIDLSIIAEVINDKKRIFFKRR